MLIDGRARNCVPGAGGGARRARRSSRSRARPTATSCTRCSARSSSTTRSSAATARRARSARRSACSARSRRAGRARSRRRRSPHGTALELDRRRDPRADERQPVPLRRVREHRPGDRRGGSTGEAVPLRARRPTPTAAVALLDGEPEARFLGGGTNLVDLMRLGVETPARPRRRHAAAATTASRTPTTAGCASAPRSATASWRPTRGCGERYPVLSQALLARRLGTAPQHGHGRRQPAAAHALRVLPRTSPSRATSASPGSGCPAREGEHRNHAILGHSRALRRAPHPSDMAVALAALDATVHVAGPARASGRSRSTELHRLPATSPQRDTVLEPGELITAVELPPPPLAATRSATARSASGASFAFALVSVAVVARRLDGDGVADVRIALGGVAHTPWRAQPGRGGAPRPGADHARTRRDSAARTRARAGRAAAR